MRIGFRAPPFVRWGVTLHTPPDPRPNACLRCGVPSPPPLPAACPQEQACAINAEQLARRSDHVGLLLGLLEDEPVGVPDFYVRYHTVQLLTALLNHCAYKLQVWVGGCGWGGGAPRALAPGGRTMDHRHHHPKQHGYTGAVVAQA